MVSYQASGSSSDTFCHTPVWIGTIFFFLCILVAVACFLEDESIWNRFVENIEWWGYAQVDHLPAWFFRSCWWCLWSCVCYTIFFFFQINTWTRRLHTSHLYEIRSAWHFARVFPRFSARPRQNLKMDTKWSCAHLISLLQCCHLLHL